MLLILLFFELFRFRSLLKLDNTGFLETDLKKKLGVLFVFIFLKKVYNANCFSSSTLNVQHPLCILSVEL